MIQSFRQRIGKWALQLPFLAFGPLMVGIHTRLWRGPLIAFGILLVSYIVVIVLFESSLFLIRRKS